MRSAPRVLLIAGTALAAGAALAAVAAAPRPSAPPPSAGGADFGRMLIEGLDATEGCLGTQTARLGSGKLAIIAWFENRAAAERWYNSDVHRRMMGGVGARPAGEPMTHLPDPDAPIMVMATITMGGEPQIPGPMPISQISIELYTPLPGGAAINGRLMPEEIDVPHFRSSGVAAPAEQPGG